MNCETVSELLPELLSGTLGREAEREILSHLAQCADCRRELAFWAQVAQAAQAGAESDAMPEALFEEVRENLFGGRTLTALESLKQAGRVLELARSVCGLALSAAGL